jgi:hypothetical protein
VPRDVRAEACAELAALVARFLRAEDLYEAAVRSTDASSTDPFSHVAELGASLRSVRAELAEAVAHVAPPTRRDIVSVVRDHVLALREVKRLKSAPMPTSERERNQLDADLIAALRTAGDAEAALLEIIGIGE